MDLTGLIILFESPVFGGDVREAVAILEDILNRHELIAEAGIVVAFPQIDVHFDREDKTSALPGEPQSA